MSEERPPRSDYGAATGGEGGYQGRRPEGGAGGRPGAQGSWGRKFQYRKKICRFTKDKVESIDYKDVELLKKFISRNGKIIPRRFTGTSARYQRMLSLAIKRARAIALLPFVGEVEFAARPSYAPAGHAPAPQGGAPAAAPEAAAQ